MYFLAVCSRSKHEHSRALLPVNLLPALWTGRSRAYLFPFSPCLVLSCLVSFAFLFVSARPRPLVCLPRVCAFQIWLTMSDGTLLDCCYCKAYSNGGRNDRRGGGDGGALPGGSSGGSGGGGGGDGGDERSSTGCVLFCNPNAGYYESMVLAGEGSRNW